MKTISSTLRTTATRRFLFIALLGLALGAAACGNGECTDCSQDSDCDKGYTCQPFEGGHHFCANSGTTSCTTT